MSKPAYPSDAAARFLVRMPEGMRDAIAEAATRNGRSMNAEVVARLQATFERSDDREEADYWREEFETLRENARTIEHTLDEFRRDREISHRWLIEAFNAHAEGKDAPPFPLEMPSGEIELRKANHKRPD